MSKVANYRQYTFFNVADICRICLLKTDNGVELFSNDEASKNITDKIYSCFRIIIDCEEYLPSIICKNCVKEVDCAEAFRIKCVTFQERLKMFLHVSINNDNDEVLDDNFDNDNVEQLEKNKEAEKDPSSISKNIGAESTVKSDEFQCHVCNKTLKSQLSLSKHIVSMHEKRKHVGKMTGHGATKKYHCTKCQYSTIYSQTLVTHMRRHNGEKPYHCFCGKSFAQSASLTTHEKTHSATLPYICSTCGKQFVYAVALKRHLRVHIPAQFSCSVCKKKLKSENSLKGHLNRHYNIKNYSCENCGNTFATSADLSNHKKIHSTEKKAECHLCDYKTTFKRNLIPHLKRHAGDTTFQCDICERGYYTRAELRRHVRVHSHEKPYPCHACSQRFKRSSSLNKHVRNFHGITSYQWKRTQSKKLLVVKPVK